MYKNINTLFNYENFKEISNIFKREYSYLFRIVSLNSIIIKFINLAKYSSLLLHSKFYDIIE